MGDGKGVFRGPRPGSREGEEKGLSTAECHQYNYQESLEIVWESTEGSGTDRGLYGRMCIAPFLSHFSCGSESYAPVEMLGNACI